MYKLYLYIINKTVKALLLTKKLDVDYWMEIDEYLDELKGKILQNHYLSKLFINNGIDLNWLTSDKIPENFDQMIKEIKSQGFLR